MDLWTYIGDREREVAEVSCAVDSMSFSPAGAIDRPDERGMIVGRVFLREDAYIEFLELVQVVGSGITREKYAYFLVVDDREVGGYERDPMHAPDVLHLHCSDRVEHERFPMDEPVSFKEAVAKAWEWLGNHP